MNVPLRNLVPLALVACAAPLPSAAPLPPVAPPPAAPSRAADPKPAPLEPLPAPSATDPASGHACTEIVGLDNVVLTFDGGKTFVQSKTPRTTHGRVHALVALGAPYTLAAIATPETGGPEDALFVSVDGGCHWSKRGPADSSRAAPELHGVAFRGEGGLVALTPDGSHRIGSLASSVSAVAADAADPHHLRLVNAEGILDSRDGGTSWQKVGSAPQNAPVSDISFASGALDTILLALLVDRPVQVTHDGGRKWTVSRGLPALHYGTLRLSGDGKTAWYFGSKVYRSSDGGDSFAQVATLTSPDQLLGSPVPVGEQTSTGDLVFAWADWTSWFLSYFNPVSLKVRHVHVDVAPPTKRVVAMGVHVDGGEAIVAGTFVPGEPNVLCLGIERRAAPTYLN